MQAMRRKKQGSKIRPQPMSRAQLKAQIPGKNKQELKGLQEPKRLVQPRSQPGQNRQVLRMMLAQQE